MRDLDKMIFYVAGSERSLLTFSESRGSLQPNGPGEAAGARCARLPDNDSGGIRPLANSHLDRLNEGVVHMPEFRLAIEGIDLPEEDVRRISRALDEAFLEQLARIGLPPNIILRQPEPPFLGRILLPGQESE